jgi:hypothetical protein
MKRSHLLPALSLGLVLSCTSDTQRETPPASQAQREPRTFHLVSIGDRPSREAAKDDPCNRPFDGQFTIKGEEWRSVHGIPAHCVAPSARGDTLRENTGVLRFRGDTLDLFMAEHRIGEQGLVQRGILRGDTSSLGLGLGRGRLCLCSSTANEPRGFGSPRSIEARPCRPGFFVSCSGLGVG